MKKNHYGLPAIILASFFFATFSALNRIVPQSVGTFHQLLIRTFLMGSIFLIIGFIRRDFSKILKKDYLLILLRGLFIIGDFATFFIAISHLQIGVTLFLFYASVIISNYIYGSLVLHEKLDKVKIFSLLLAVVGLGIMYINNLGAFVSIFVIFALFSGFSYGLGVASSKSLDKYSVTQVNSMAFLCAAFLSIPLLFISHEQSSITFMSIPFFPFFIWSGVGVLAFYLIIYGFKHVEAHKASLISLSEIIFAIFIGLLIYNEIPTLQTIIGGICIIIALALPNLKWKSKK
ncbi:MAG TPA: DMT family transporter [Patescibacteria group bacterium]